MANKLRNTVHTPCSSDEDEVQLSPGDPEVTAHPREGRLRTEGNMLLDSWCLRPISRILTFLHPIVAEVFEVT